MSKKFALGSLAIFASASLGATIGTNVASASPESAKDKPQVVTAQSEQLIPHDKLTDWRSFSDHLVVVTVTDERKLAPSAEEIAAGEGLIPRVIDLKIDSIIWSRPGAPDAPTSITINFDGWEFKGDKLVPLRSRGEPMLSVGKKYVTPIVKLAGYDSSANNGWSPLAPDAIIPYRSGVLGVGDPLITTRADASAVWRRYYKEPVTVLSQAIRHTAPYAAANDQVPVEQRVKDVYQASTRR